MVKRNKSFEEKMLEKLDVITKLLIWIHADTSDKTLKDKIRTLSRLGLSPSAIADILGKPANLIRVMKHSIKFQDDKNEEE